VGTLGPSGRRIMEEEKERGVLRARGIRVQ